MTPANRSSAFGSFNVTNGDFSTVVGFNNTTSVSATQAIVLGASSSATGLGSVAIGRSCTTGGSYATTTGFTNTASGDTSTAIGSTNLASGTTATATGFTTTASGNFATSMGTRTTAQAYASLVIGQFNTLSGTTTAWVATDPVLVVGNGASVAAPANALTLLKNGNMTIAGTLTQASDERLKESVEELSGVLERLKDVRGVSYRFRKDAPGPQGRQVGLVAQEVRKAFPELVHEDSDGTLSVAYGNFSAVLLEAVKEQQRQIEAQRVELQRRDAQFARLAAAVAALEKRLDASEDAKLRRGHFGISDRRRPPISFSIGEVAL